MATTDKQVQFIVVDDFSPGIYQNPMSKSAGSQQKTPNGAAQLTGTYACTSSATGSLVPGPAIVGNKTESPFDSPWNSTHYLFDYVKIIAFRNMSPVYPTGSPTQFPPLPDMPFVTYQYYYDPTGANVNYHLRARTRAYKHFASDLVNTGLTSYDVWTQDDAVVYNQAVTTNPVVLYGSASIDLTRANNASPITPGNATVVGAYYPVEQNAGTGRTWVYPKNSTPTVDSTEAMGFSTIGNASIQAVVAHQDRVIGFAALKTANSQSGFGTSGQSDPSEYFEYLAVNNYSATGGILLVVSQNPSGYGSWRSMNASTLFLVKKNFGGVLVQGALEQPTITYMPGVQGTGPLANIGGISPSGTYIYGTSNGVYEWAGGDTCNLLSPQLYGSFWIPQDPAATNSSYGPVGSFASAGPYVFAPNGFLYNTVGGGWWRTIQPNAHGQVLAWHETSANGMVLGAYQYFNSVDTNVYSWLDPNTPNPNGFQWVSQPFNEGINRELAFREVNITVSGGAAPLTITVTLQGLLSSPPAGSNVATFTFAGGVTPTPRTISMPIYCDAWDMYATVTASNACEIHRISFGYYEEETAR